MPKGSAAVVCSEPHAARAGGRILEAGGNAVDAAIAAAYAQGVVNPLMCGIGGTGRMLVHEASTKQSVLVDFGTHAGSLATPDVYGEVEQNVFANRFRAKDWANYIGHASVTIPSFVQGTWEGHQHFGALAWEALLEPAIELAAEGFDVDDNLFSTWDPDRDRHSDSPPPMVKLRATEECQRIYLRNGEPYQVGDTLVQRDYAATLERIAAGGADEFYRGALADEIARDFAANGGLFTREDLAACRAAFLEPKRGTYKGLDVLTEGSPSMGSLEIEALQILDHIDLDAVGRHSSAYYDLLARVFHTIYSDRARWNADPRYVDVPEHLMLSRDRARDLAAQLAQGASGAPRHDADAAAGADETTHVSVVDAWGNAAAMSHSNGNSAGVVTPGLGFLYNHHMHNFDPRPGQRDSIAPHKRPLFGCSPLMAFDDEHLRVTSGAKSRYRVTAEIQLLVDVLDGGTPLDEAIRRPRIHAEYDASKLFVEPAVPAPLRSELARHGWSCVEVDMAVPMCTVLSDGRGRVESVADPRGGGGIWTS